MNAVEIILRIVAVVRALGVRVTFEPGWETRGNGTSASYVGGIWHHTAGAYATSCPGLLIYGRSDLSGPLCNFAGLAGGGLHVVAAHPANHAGASGGRSMGPLPVTRLFNPRVLGLEICYPGDRPMTDAQYRTAAIWGHAVALVLGGGDVQRVRAHAETSVEGKWDPGYAPSKTIDVNALRTTAAHVEEDDMSEHTEQQVDDLWRAFFSDKNIVNQTIYRAVWSNGDQLARMFGVLQSQSAALAAIANDRDITPEQLTATVTGAVDRAVDGLAEQLTASLSARLLAEVGPAMVAVLGELAEGQAHRVVDEIQRRLNAAPPAPLAIEASTT
ncbi:N-acetylmuramoyl-L-alanine amidase [Saccharothrix lopnurensis]|uniref:N-acetylmuramoyl-L-alanine amidase n=1 Tax=Saccharothrix lopnurensis TaxID=1670621 RepID=A0ABW1P623_9PSEU